MGHGCIHGSHLLYWAGSFLGRIDVVPKEYIKELVMLQDNVPGFPFEVGRMIIEEDLGRPLEELYDSFSSVPLAAASLGQVCRGV